MNLGPSLPTAEMEKWSQRKQIRIASFDIGKKNFAQYVEDCQLEALRSLRETYGALPKSGQRRVKGVLTPEIKDILKGLFLTGTRVHCGVFDFRADPQQKKLDNATRINFLQHLKSWQELWDTCDVFVIEQQFFSTFGGRGGGANMDAIKLGEATTMWFLEHCPGKDVVCFGSQYKTQTLGAPVKLNKPQRKKWSVEKTLEIFQQRQDTEALALYDLIERVKRKRLNTEEKVQVYLEDFRDCAADIRYLAEKIVRERQKMDDVADVVIQAQAYKYRTFVADF
jgi:hypothetical protein